jgi:hypothetical protein
MDPGEKRGLVGLALLILTATGAAVLVNSIFGPTVSWITFVAIFGLGLHYGDNLLDFLSGRPSTESPERPASISPDLPPAPMPHEDPLKPSPGATSDQECFTEFLTALSAQCRVKPSDDMARMPSIRP